MRDGKEVGECEKKGGSDKGRERENEEEGGWWEEGKLKVREGENIEKVGESNGERGGE